MKKILIIVCAVLMMTACKKEQSEVATVTLRFSPYEVSPMKTASVSTVCSRLDVYIVDTLAGDTLRFHQDRGVTGAGFGSVSAVLQTTRGYKLLAIAHGFTDTVGLSNGVFVMPDEKLKQTMVAVQTFSPADSLNLTVVMQRIVGMFKCRVADEIPDNVAQFTFQIDSAGYQWHETGHSLGTTRRMATITGMARGSDGYVDFNVYVMADDLSSVKYVDITATAQDADLQAVETREFAQVPIKAGYVTTYSGTFFITFDMGFTFEVDDWGNYGSYTF